MAEFGAIINPNNPSPDIPLIVIVLVVVPAPVTLTVPATLPVVSSVTREASRVINEAL